MSFKEIKSTFVKLWCTNIKKDYKKISIAIGSILNALLSILIVVLIVLATKTIIDAYFSGVLSASLLMIQVGVNIIISSIFGKAPDNQSKNILSLEAELVGHTIKSDPELTEVFTRKMAEELTKQLQNGDKNGSSVDSPM